jgi:hypothetical protein
MIAFAVAAIVELVIFRSTFLMSVPAALLFLRGKRLPWRSTARPKIEAPERDAELPPWLRYKNDRPRSWDGRVQ